METTIQLSLDAELVESLERTTAQQGISVNQVMTDMARKYVLDARRKLIADEFERYKQMHHTLKKTLLGEHVAIYKGALIDHDADSTKLVARVRERYGHAPILFVQVEESSEPEIMIHSTRVVESHGNIV